MKTVLEDTDLATRDDFIQSLVDLFYRCNKNSSHYIKFEDLTSYLIDHEIQHHTEQATQMDTIYYENKDIVDKTSHNSNIEKIFFFEEIDKVLLYAQGQEIIRVYDACKMKQDATIVCPSKILAIEFIPDKKAVAVSLSDRSILFYDSSNNFKRLQKQLNVPSTQKCLAYIKRKGCLFTAGIDGAIFAWDLAKLFSKDH
jgi:WD40 repeat protein